MHALHPWPKLLLLLWAVLAPFALPVVAIPLLIVAFVGAAVTARLGLPFARAVVVGSLVVGIPIVLLNGLLFPGARDVLLPLGPLAVTREGLEFGLSTAGRLAAALAAATAFGLSTRPDDLMEGLVARGLSPRLAFAMLVALSAIPRLGRSAHRLLDGARTRGLRTTGSVGARAGAFRTIAGALAVWALLDVRDRTLALESRGFSIPGPRTAHRSPAWRPVDRWVARLAVAGLLVLLAVAVLRLAGTVRG